MDRMCCSINQSSRRDYKPSQFNNDLYKIAPKSDVPVRAATHTLIRLCHLEPRVHAFGMKILSALCVAPHELTPVLVVILILESLATYGAVTFYASAFPIRAAARGRGISETSGRPRMLRENFDLPVWARPCPPVFIQDFEPGVHASGVEIVLA